MTEFCDSVSGLEGTTEDRVVQPPLLDQDHLNYTGTRPGRKELLVSLNKTEEFVDLKICFSLNIGLRQL